MNTEKRIDDDGREAHRELGERLKEVRRYLGLKQDEVAQYLKIRRSALSEIETGTRRVEVPELKRLAKLYQHPVAYFTGEEAVASGLPADMAHLTRRIAGLSPQDRYELGRFAEYLRARSQMEAK